MALVLLTGSDITWTVEMVAPATLTLAVDASASNPTLYRWYSDGLGHFNSAVYNINVTASNDINTESILGKYISWYTSS